MMYKLKVIFLLFSKISLAMPPLKAKPLYFLLNWPIIADSLESANSSILAVPFLKILVGKKSGFYDN